jgi:D-sedoheptulose 7-phosphate isomerase
VREAAVARRSQERVRALLAERIDANERFFGPQTERLARLCHRMAERFARSGRLIALAASPAARSDARHVAVEFVHPVIVGKRALPAIALTGDRRELTAEVGLLAGPQDIAMAFGTDEDEGAAAGALRLAGELRCLTLAFSSAGAEWEFEPPVGDRYIRQELVETLYHVLWELVHVFFEHRGLLEGRDSRPTHDVGASSFLYPFLAEREHDLDDVIADVARSARIKSQEISALRAQTLTDNAATLIAAADDVRASLQAGGKLLALGNGGSATDAMDAVADFRAPGRGARAWPAIDLTEDPAILTAIANDIGTEAMFSRQVIAYGRPGDVLLALSTSGNSGNVIEALAQGRRQELRTVAMVGYDGGRIRAERLADHVIVSRSEHIPRIQEAQASAYHVLRVLVEEA